MITHIAFDADDTLWHEIDQFKETENELVKLLIEYHEEDWIRERFDKINIQNLDYFGYGLKGFTLSMIETAITLSDSRISSAKIHQIIEMAKNMKERPIQVIDGVEDVLFDLHHDYTMMLITKGDLFDQESKIARSGIGDYFDIVEIVSNKSVDTYNAILKKHHIEPDQFMMIGNSMKSDILPVINLGCKAIHIPYTIEWSHEISEKIDHTTFYELRSIKELRKLLSTGIE